MGNCYYGKFAGGIPVKSEIGPICRTVEDVILVHQYLYEEENYRDVPPELLDPYIKHIPFNWSILNNPPKCKIGLVKALRTTRVSKANERAVDVAASALRKKGHEVVEVELGGIEGLFHYLAHLITFDQ
jgi:Asp-tRNA(Asn)/Glu-tRNA(Gln) amidotransferase A subunit family amidase